MTCSPITNSSNIKLIEEIKVKDILNEYSKIGINNIEKYFSGLKVIQIYECLDTGYRFYYPKNIFGDDIFYAYLQDQRKYYASWRWEHGEAEKEIENGDNVLEIGCGIGNFMNKIKDKSNVVGLEFNKKAIKSAKKKGLNIHNESIEKYSRKNEGKYDVVCCFQVLEHVYDVHNFLESAIKCLKTDGILMIGVPNNNPYLYRYDKLHALNLPPHHTGLWNIKSLKSISRLFNMNVEKIKVEPLRDVDYFWSIQRIYWKKNNKIKFLFSGFFDDNLINIRNYIIPKICYGRNIILIYKKNE